MLSIKSYPIQARGHLGCRKGTRSRPGQQDWQRIFTQASISYESARFLIQKLGAERYLEPELMATLALVRRGLLSNNEHSTAADTMMADTAVIDLPQSTSSPKAGLVTCASWSNEALGARTASNRYHGPTVGAKLEKRAASA